MAQTEASTVISSAPEERFHPESAVTTRVPTESVLRSNAFLIVSVAALTVLGYLLCPGHIYLYHDTLIYVPMLEHLWNPSVLTTDFLATRPHLSFTIYDEVAVALRRLTGIGFGGVLGFQQLTFRAVAVLGMYLIARALKLSGRMAMLAAAVFALGATTLGAALSSLEFEPVPRSFAFPLVLLGLGLTAANRYFEAGMAASIGFLYHPPIGYPFWLAHAAAAFLRRRERFTIRRFSVFLPLVCSASVLFLLSRYQTGGSTQDSFFHRIGPLQYQLQYATAPYLWVSVWPHHSLEQYIFLGIAAGLALWRLRDYIDVRFRFFLAGLPLIGLLSIPVSYVLLEKLRWSLMPQFQPMRALVYFVVVTGFLTTVAGIHSVQQRRYVEGFFWLAIAFAIPTEPRVLHIIAPRLGSLAIPLVRNRVLIVAGLAVLALIAIWCNAQHRRWAGITLFASMLSPFFALHYLGQVNHLAPRDNPEIHEVSAWARNCTGKDDTFLFLDSGDEPDPSVFRVHALRPVYVDWLSNGQVNFSEEFTRVWWFRWLNLEKMSLDPAESENYTRLGINYIVVHTTHHLTGERKVFENSRYRVYRVDHGMAGNQDSTQLRASSVRPVCASIIDAANGHDRVNRKRIRTDGIPQL